MPLGRRGRRSTRRGYEQDSRYNAALCIKCGQDTSRPSIKYYFGHPQNSRTEEEALREYREDGGMEPVGIMNYTVYDEEGHLCAVEMVDNKAELFVSGHLVMESDNEVHIPVRDIGPILSWFIKGDKYVVFTLNAEYELLSPDTKYSSDLGERQTATKTKSTERKAPESSDSDVDRLIQSFCMLESKDSPPLTKAITTPLVKKSFAALFPYQLNKEPSVPTDQARCGVCAACQLPDCGECAICKTKPKFGGKNTKKAICSQKRCLNISPTYEECDDSVEEITDRYETVEFKDFPYKRIVWPTDPLHIQNNIIFYEFVNFNRRKIIRGDYVMLQPNQSNVPMVIARVAYLWSIVNKPQEGYFHAQVMYRSEDTVLGEQGNPREIFVSDTCFDNLPLTCIRRKANVFHKIIPENWSSTGGEAVDSEECIDDGQTYFYQKSYEMFSGSFENVPSDNDIAPLLRECAKSLGIFCAQCLRKTMKEMTLIPILGNAFHFTTRFSDDTNIFKVKIEPDRLEFDNVIWRNCKFEKGDGLLLRPGTFKVSRKVLDKQSRSWEKNDPKNTKNSKLAAPYDVACIVAITGRPLMNDLVIPPKQIYFKVKRLYRPEQTINRFPQHEDLNLLYWSDEIYDVPARYVMGHCRIFYIDNIPQGESPDDWVEKDPTKFYFTCAYDRKTEQFVPVPAYATIVGSDLNAKGKHSEPTERERKNVKVRPLRTLDLFAGAGGLSEGLKRAGVADCRWAVEVNDTAATTYAFNHPECQIYREDANTLLGKIISGRPVPNDIPPPPRGEVELICAGPPCQGFSRLNRFSEAESSRLKNSLITTFLSYVDYYRPKYVIFENVSNIVYSKNGMVLKTMLRVFVDIGYQCRFTILQAGNHGVPQARRRLFVVAAAPGCTLPKFPDPSNVFGHSAKKLNIKIDEKVFFTDTRWFGIPLRGVTVYDAIFDLPHITSGTNCTQSPYNWQPYTHYQRMMRQGSTDVVRDHMCKSNSPISQERINRIPVKPGSDWRDLPNISVPLSDGTQSDVLVYKNDVKPKGKKKRNKDVKKSQKLRSVCPCAEGQACTKTKHHNTLIPFSVAHTAHKNNNWAGVYGRVAWYEHFSTTLTNPDPMRSQGRVLHPGQNRILSVRECARSQGFRDNYQFFGTMEEKYKMIGNAVPPPLATHLGIELNKAMENNSEKNN